METQEYGFKGEVPAEGHFFDRVDIEGEMHTRTQYRDGLQVLTMGATPDLDRPGKWNVVVAWNRRGKWHNTGWGPLDSEKDALAMMDAVGIGVEAITGGSICLQHLPAPPVT